MRLALLLAAVLMAPVALAQAPLVLNGPIPEARAERLLDEALFPPAAGEPDTTSPWRYFPMHVGDAWEYYEYPSGNVFRRVVTGETVREGRLYFVHALYYSENGQPPVFLFNYYLRFDTLTTRVLEPSPEGERPSLITPCRFDAPWGSVVSGCYPFPTATVSGGYDGLLIFGGALPGTGTDTVVVAYKAFASKIVDLEYRYAADFGLAYEFSGDSGTGIGLTFSRVDGVAHGLERFPNVPTAPEEGPAGRGALALAVSPNPARDEVRVSLTLDRPAAVRVEVHDVLGRRVRSLDLGRLAPGRHEAALDLAGLAPGAYVVRVTAGAEAATRPLTRRD